MSQASPPSQSLASAPSHLPAGHPPVARGKVGVLLLNLGTPDGTDFWPMWRYLREFLSVIAVECSQGIPQLRIADAQGGTAPGCRSRAVACPARQGGAGDQKEGESAEPVHGDPRIAALTVHLS